MIEFLVCFDCIFELVLAKHKTEQQQQQQHNTVFEDFDDGVCYVMKCLFRHEVYVMS